MNTNKVVNHWGTDSNKPVTGVAQNNHVEFLYEEINNGIDITLDEAIEDYKQENPDASDEDISDKFDMWDSSSDTILIGKWTKDKDGLYIPDKTGEYSAIVGEIYTQVIWSKTSKKCSLCSPCYPGQGDLDSDGEFLTYDLPADMHGDNQ